MYDARRVSAGRWVASGVEVVAQRHVTQVKDVRLISQRINIVQKQIWMKNCYSSRLGATRGNRVDNKLSKESQRGPEGTI